MLNEPIIVTQPSFQLAWLTALNTLSQNNWELYNLIVHIQDPTNLNTDLHQKVYQFCKHNSIINPKDVAYTIFPHNAYYYWCSGDKLFHLYNRKGGFFDRLRKRPRSGWGTYFRRMTQYEGIGGEENQLQNIINAINTRNQIYKAAYTICIQKPGRETTRPLGGPCLNYLAIQMKPTSTKPILGVLCIYRNHDFLEKAYGNYWGICNLTLFLSKETGSSPGPVTIISSHAYVEKLKTATRNFLKKN